MDPGLKPKKSRSSKPKGERGFSRGNVNANAGEWDPLRDGVTKGGSKTGKRARSREGGDLKLLCSVDGTTPQGRNALQKETCERGTIRKKKVALHGLGSCRSIGMGRGGGSQKKNALKKKKRGT